MGMLFQKRAFDSLTVSDNIAFPLRGNEPPKMKFSIKVEYFCRLWELPIQLSFSGRNQWWNAKRLGINSRIGFRSRNYILRRPYRFGLDPITSRKIIDLILELKVRKPFHCGSHYKRYE